MSFFELFKIVHATHFILTCPLSLILWLYIPAANRPVFQPANSSTEVIIAIAVSVLSLSWYFVWYGSLVFAFRGRFPLLSPRAFSILLGVVYVGFAFVSHVASETLSGGLLTANPLYQFAFCAILSLSGFGAVFLPGLTVQEELEQERLAQERDRRLDSLYPWGSSDTKEAAIETEDK